MIIGVDYHPSFQQIAFFVEETGECGEQELNHIIGTPERFLCGKQIGTYVGMIPSEDSSARKQRRWGTSAKQGNSLLRFLLVEAAQAAARSNTEWRRRYTHLAMRRNKSIAKVAMGRKLGVRLYWMWRNGCAYSPSFVGQLGTGHGVK